MKPCFKCGGGMLLKPILVPPLDGCCGCGPVEPPTPSPTVDAPQWPCFLCGGTRMVKNVNQRQERCCECGRPLESHETPCCPVCLGSGHTSEPPPPGWGPTT